MNDKSLHTLEYDKIINKLVNYANSDIAKDLCRHLLPSDNLEEILLNQANTSDALSRIYKTGGMSFSGLKDITPSLKRLEVGGSLSIVELLNISSLLNIATKAKTFSRDLLDDEATQDSLDAMFALVSPLTNLNNQIKSCIISEDEIADDASKNLSSIRRSIKLTHDRIRAQLNSILNSSTYRTYLQDFIITMRNDRFCLPVKSEHKNQFPGMIHDQSSTGSTVFIEPMSVVKLNNELRELSIKEKEEIEMILQILSEACSQFTEDLYTNLSVLTKLDFIFAKAYLAKEQKASMPLFNDKGYINLKQARHPLLDQQTVVPIDISMGDSYSMVIITGPNTGGKTVTLKTVGLLTLMGQAGLFIPAYPNSSLNVFEDIFADIGDEQSIEQSLSTFSSHMKNIINIVEKATDKTLVLFDELGAGTDPTEGAALAISILSFLHNMKIRVIATTHYSELKLFALNTNGITNASCEFDINTLRPTYKLLIGIPGKSNAFAISKKLGLPDFIIDTAKKSIDTNDKAFEDILTELDAKKRELELEKETISNYKNEVEALKTKLQNQYDNLEAKKTSILEKANTKATELLEEAKEFADATIKNINKYSAGGSNKDLENERRKAGEKLSNLRSKNGKLLNKPSVSNTPPKKSPNELSVGDKVLIISMGVEGTITTIPKNGSDLVVSMGFLTSTVKRKDVRFLSGPVKEDASKTSQMSGMSSIKVNKSSNISTEVNLIGLNTDEALYKLDKYIDDAYLSHLPHIRIVHGKGSGILRKAVQSHLKNLSHIDSYRLGEIGEGGDGVTIATFK